MVIAPKPFKAQLKSKILLAEDTYDFIFETSEPVEFQAGQFLYITINDGQEPVLKRAYSICSAPHEANNITLCVKIIPGGRATNWLLNLSEGTEVDFLAPLGHFTFQEDSTHDALFIATGTGIAPLNSMIEERLYKKDLRRVTLLFGVRHESHLFYQDKLKKLASENSNFNVITTLSQPENESWKGEKGRVTDWLNNNFDQKFKAENTDIYICGLGEMVQEVQKILMEKGVPKEQIHFERYN